jgi:hypothetical protein
LAPPTWQILPSARTGELIKAVFVLAFVTLSVSFLGGGHSGSLMQRLRSLRQRCGLRSITRRQLGRPIASACRCM